MKKTVCILLALVMLLSMGTIAFAEADAKDPDYTTGTP